MEMVNLLLGVYTKSGSLVQINTLGAFFNSGTDFISDPKVQYDAASGRWFASVTDVTSDSILLAVSANADPTGSWHRFTITGTGCLDQPILGVGTSTVILSANVFSSCTSNTFTYLGAQYWVVSKADLLAGAASPAMVASTPDVTEESIHPVQIEGTSASMYMVSTYWPGALTTSDTLHLFTVSGTPPSTVTVTVTSLSMPTAAVPPSAGQLGTRNTLDTSDIRVSDAVWDGGKLWLGFDEACLSDASRACIRLVQIDTAAGTILQDFDIDVAGKDTFYPGLRVDGSGDLAVVFGYSSASDYPGIMATGRVFGDAPNTLQAPQVVVAGTGPEQTFCSKSVCRFGDYFGASRDPSNASVVWLAGEMGTPSGWSTHVFSVSVKAELTLAYEVVGGGSGYGAPAVSFVNGGVPAEAALGISPATVLADPGSAWSVSSPLPGSSPASGEVWAVNASSGAAATSGLANTSVTRTFAYFHQYRTSLDFTVTGGAGYTAPPTVTATVFGVSTSLVAPGTVYLDAGSAYAYQEQLAGSTSSERWIATSAANGTVSAALTLNVPYYHQVLVTFDYSIAGTTVSAPQVHFSSAGSPASATANATVWADSQAVYAYDSALAGATAGSRWGPGSNGNGTVTAPQTVLVVYREQFHLSVTASPSNLSAYATASGWYDAGSTVTLSASPPSGWEFGGWSGDASGTASGVPLQMGGPMSVTALFVAGFTIAAGDGGSVAYAYGSVSGTVPAGTSFTLYVPVGTEVTVTAQPSSWTQVFTGWSGAAGGVSATTTVTVSGPTTAGAGFGLNALAVAGLSLLVVLILAALVVFLVLRRRRRRPPA